MLPSAVTSRVGHGLVDELVELAAVDDLDEGRALAVGGDDPDGGRVLDADALAEGVVGLHLGGQLALRIDGEGQGDAVALRELLGELGELAGVSMEGWLAKISSR